MNHLKTVTDARSALLALVALCDPAGDLSAYLPSFAHLIRTDASKTLAGVNALIGMAGELDALDCLDDVYGLAPAALESEVAA